MAAQGRQPSPAISRCSVGELDGVARQTEQHLREALFVTEGNWDVHGRRQRELLVLGDSVAARTVSTTLSMAYSVMFRVNWPDSILAMSSTVLMRPSKCLPLE